MFKSLTKKSIKFQFNQKEFEIFDKELVPLLLGKSGNQTAINGAGSTWKKIIKRYKTDKQDDSEKYNPKYYELFNKIKDHINTKEFNEETKFDELQKELILKLNKFKKEYDYRKKILNILISEDFSFQKNIPLDLTYIFLCLYIMSNYSYYEKEDEETLRSFNFGTKENFLGKCYNILSNEKNSINNLTAFCYTQYFWFDYHLSDSDHSEIHKIIYDILCEIHKGSSEQSIKNEEFKADLNFKAEEKSIGDLLELKKQYIIPDFQRVFSWQNEQINSFMNDFLNVYNNNDKIPKYFLGSIVLTKNGDNLEVIDGQQRLTTALILLSVIKELYDKDELKEVIQEYFTYSIIDGDKKTEKHKIILNKSNKDFFVLYFTSSKSEVSRKTLPQIFGSNKLILSAYEIIKNKIITHPQYREGNTFLTDLLNILTKKIIVVQIVVDDERTANTIFETLNDRGKNLEIYENIKNHIYGRVYEQIEEVKIIWNTLIEVYSKQLSNYLLAVYRSKYEPSYKKLGSKNFYVHFKETVNIKDYYTFSLGLENEIAVYNNLRNPNEENWDIKTFEKLDCLKAFDVEGIYLVLLSAYIKDFHFHKILNLCLGLVFKNKFSKELPFGINVLATRISNQIRNDEITIEKIEKELGEYIQVNDEKIKINFLEGDLYRKGKGNLAKKLLIVINKSDEKRKSIDWNALTVEHIYSNSSPSSFKNRIKQIEAVAEKKNKEKTKFDKNHIYNLTLLPKKENESVSNLDFPDKKKIYARNSEIPTTKILSEFDDYNYESYITYRDYLWNKVKKLFNL